MASLPDLTADLGELLQTLAAESARGQSVPLAARLLGAAAPAVSLAQLSSRVAAAGGRAELPCSEVASAVDALLEWALGSLDFARPSLLRVAYALLLHSYVELVLRCAGGAAEGGAAFAAARGLVERHRDTFLGLGLGCSELFALALVTGPEQLFAGCAPTRAARLRALLGLGEDGRGAGAPTAVLGALQAVVEAGRDGVGRPEAQARGPPLAPRLPEPRAAAAKQLMDKLEAGVSAARREGSLAAQRAAPHAPALQRFETAVLQRLADPSARTTLALPPLALDLLITFLCRAGPGGQYLLALLNERCRIEAQPPSEALGGGGSGSGGGARRGGMLAPAAEDVAMGIMWGAKRAAAAGYSAGKAISSASDPLDRTLLWGVPTAPAGAYVGALERHAIPSPAQAYAASPYGRAVLASMAVHSPASPEAATPTLSAASSSSALPQPLLHLSLLEDTADALRACAGVCSSAHRVKVVCAGFLDGMLLAWVTMPMGSVHLRGTPASAMRGGPITACAVSACGSYALTGHVTGSLALWHLASHAAAARQHFGEARRAAGLTAGAGAGAGAAASASAPSAQPVPLDAGTAMCITRSIEPLCTSYQCASRSACAVWALAFNPCAPGIFASGGRDGVAYVWSTGQSEPQRVCVGHGSDVTALAWHANGLYLCTGSSDGSARLWEAEHGNCLRVFNPAISAACRLASGGSGEASASSASASSANSSSAVACAAPPVTSLAVSPGGRFLALGDEQGTVSLWDIPSGTAVAVWTALHSAQASRVPPANTLAAAAAAAPAAVALALSPVHSLSFTALGRHLVAGCTVAATDSSSSSSGSSGSSGSSIVYTWDVVTAVGEWEKRAAGGVSSGAGAAAPLHSVTKLPGVTSFQLCPMGGAASADLLLLGAKL